MSQNVKWRRETIFKFCIVLILKQTQKFLDREINKQKSYATKYKTASTLLKKKTFLKKMVKIEKRYLAVLLRG